MRMQVLKGRGLDGMGKTDEVVGAEQAVIMGGISAEEDKFPLRRARETSHMIQGVSWCLEQVETPIIEEINGVESADCQGGIERNLDEFSAIKGILSYCGVRIEWISRVRLWVALEPWTDNQGGCVGEQRWIPGVVDMRMAPDDGVDGIQCDGCVGKLFSDILENLKSEPAIWCISRS